MRDYLKEYTEKYKDVKFLQPERISEQLHVPLKDVENQFEQLESERKL